MRRRMISVLFPMKGSVPVFSRIRPLPAWVKVALNRPRPEGMAWVSVHSLAVVSFMPSNIFRFPFRMKGAPHEIALGA